MTCNFIGMLRAPELKQPPVFVATYSSGFGFVRKEIQAPNRLAAYAIASMRPPEGHTLTALRKKKGSGPDIMDETPAEPIAAKIDAQLAKVRKSSHTNTDLACRFIADEIRSLAQGALA